MSIARSSGSAGSCRHALLGLQPPGASLHRQPRLGAGLARAASRRRPTTSSSSAAAAMAWRPPTTSPRSTASPMSRSSRRAISARQCRPQHHHRPLELSACRQHPLLRMVDEALGRARAGHQLQRHGQPARRAQSLPLRRAARRLCAARQRDAAQRRRRGTARPGRGPAARALSSISTMPASRSAAACCSGAAARCATTRSPGAMPAPPTGAASTSSRTAK